MERLGPLDATFLAIEDAVNHMHIGSVAVLEGPAPGIDELRALVGSKLPLVERYRQKVVTAPGSIGRPVWVDDSHFRLAYHVRHTALPPPGGHEQLRQLVGRVMSQQLDRHKPLWEMWLVEGLGDGTWACITKVHHCMVDGIAGSDLLAVILDTEPRGAPTDMEPPDWEPEPDPSSAQLAWHSLSGLAGAPVRFARRAGELAAHPADTALRALDALRGVTRLGSTSRMAPDSSLMGPIGPHRQWEACRVELDDIKAVRKTFDCTVNDVVLAMVTAGFRRLLEHRDENVEDREIAAMVPVSMRAEDARGTFDNRVAALLTALPVRLEDAIERLGVVRDRMAQLKESGEATASDVFVEGTGFVPPAVAALTTRLMVHRQHMVETVATNVPGPQFPLYALERRMLEAYPYVPIAGQMRLNVAIWSYCGGVHFGLTADADDADDLGVMAEAITDSLDELLRYTV